MRIVTDEHGTVNFYMGDSAGWMPTMSITPGHKVGKEWIYARCSAMSSPSTDNADHMRLFALVLLKAADVLDEMRAKEEIETEGSNPCE